MPKDSLHDLALDFVELSARLIEKSANHEAIGHETDALIQTWYDRALFAREFQRSPEEPIVTREDWERLPDRWFEESGASTTDG